MDGRGKGNESDKEDRGEMVEEHGKGERDDGAFLFHLLIPLLLIGMVSHPQSSSLFLIRPTAFHP